MFEKFKRRAGNYEWRAVRCNMKYDSKRQRIRTSISPATEVAALADRLYIGRYNPDKDLHLYGEYNRLKLDLNNRTVHLVDLLSAEVAQRIREAPRVTLSNLNRDGTDLLYCPFMRPFDEEVSLNQRAALYGQVPHLKLFAVTCNSFGQIGCCFYNEQTQLLSEWFFDYDSSSYEAICCLATYEGQRYLIFCDGGFSFEGDMNFVLRYGDGQADIKNQRTYLFPKPFLPR